MRSQAWVRIAREKRAARASKSAASLTFRQFIDTVHPRYQWYAHCETFANVLQRVADGELRRVMFFVPPRHGKSETVSRLFTAYYLYRHPERFVGINCYAADLAYTFSRAARDHFQRVGGVIRGDAAAVKHWETAEGGGLWAAGVGGPITGKGAHLALIDDPIKNAEEAASEVIRAKQLDWYDSTLYTRLEPDSALVIVQTRWNEKDLSGELLTREESEHEGWHIVNFAAIKDAEPDKRQFPASCTIEPDTRAIGEALCPERYTADDLGRIRRKIGEYYFSALYQGRPAPREGGMFTAASFPIIARPPVIPKADIRVRWWDMAATENGGDWTVGALIAYYDDTFFIEDVVRVQYGSAKRNALIRATAEQDASTYGTVYTWGPQDPGSAGKDAAIAFRSLLLGFPNNVRTESGSKELRATPLADQAAIGRVKMYAAPWNAAFIEEAKVFPNGTHDDQIDAAAGAFNRICAAIAGWVKRPATNATTPPDSVPSAPAHAA